MTQNSDLLNAIISGIQEKRGNNIISMSFKEGKASICDYFVICDAKSDRQVLAIADSVLEFAFKNAKEKPVHIEGKENAEWVLIDFTDIIVHIFKSDFRKFYGLEELWADSEIEQYDSTYSSII